MFLNPNVEIILLLDGIFLIFLSISLFLSVKLFINWDFNATTNIQYKLEKQSYLLSTIIKYVFILKIPLFLFFIFTIDGLSNLIVGAMCSAGVIDSSSYGIPLLILKVVNLYLFGFWLIIHYGDLKFEDLRFTKLKFAFFIIASLLIIFELLLDFLMFDSIDLEKIALCCGALFSNAQTSYLGILLSVDSFIYGYLCYGIFIFLIIGYLVKNDYIFSTLSLLFLVVSILSLIIFFSPYIYELPTHHCPFCILQKEYLYIGYVLYISLFLGTFFALSLSSVAIVGGNKLFYYRASIVFLIIYLIVVSYFPISYYLKNGVLL